MSSLSQFIHTINQSAYKLDAIGVVGLFGGDRAADALETIHLYSGRKWAGWYNYPGGITVAMRFGQMARSRIWDTIFPGPNQSPTVIFKFTGQRGPHCFGVFSGTTWRTGYPGRLIAEESLSLAGEELRLTKEDGSAGRKSFNPGVVTIVSLSPKLDEDPARIVKNSVSGRYFEYVFNAAKKRRDLPYHAHVALWSIAPTLVSILSCVFAFLSHDPLCASLVLLGIVASGFSSLVLGSATLILGTHLPSPSMPPSPGGGDGLMFPADGNIIILKGKAADVREITSGELKLEYVNWVRAGGTYHMVGISSLLLVAQVLVQFILLPRCTFFGQILALISFLTSGIYHLYVVSVSPDSKKLHWEALQRTRGYSLRIEKWLLGTRTQMTVFVCLVLGDGNERRSQGLLESHPDAVLICNIPIKAAVWEYWRRKVIKELLRFWESDERPTWVSYVPGIQVTPEDDTEIDEYAQFTEQDKENLGDLIDDAWCVFSAYPKWREDMSVVFRKEREKIIILDSTVDTNIA